MKILRIISATLCAVCLVFNFTYVKKVIGKQNVELQAQEYKGIITVWQVDGFEGGKGSRRKFLMSVAREFENNYLGIPVMVVNHTIESANERLKEGDSPDVLSYCLGVEVKDVVQLRQDKTFTFGSVNNKCYALPWCKGGYVLITKAQSKIDLLANNFDNIIVSQSLYTQPLVALSMENVTVKNFIQKEPIDAYVDFVNEKDGVLLATQRDIVRLENRGIEIRTRALKEYNDLYQYLSVFSADEQKLVYVEKFISLVLSEKWQKKLCDIGLMSEYHTTVHDNEHLKKMSMVKGTSSLSAFVDQSTLKKFQTLSAQAVTGNQSSFNKIKKMVLLP